MRVAYIVTDTMKGTTVYVDPKEALSIIESLAAQMKAGNPNTGRLEWKPEHEISTNDSTVPTGVRYFSIFVTKEG